jgi:hypothetical protein
VQSPESSAALPTETEDDGDEPEAGAPEAGEQGPRKRRRRRRRRRPDDAAPVLPRTVQPGAAVPAEKARPFPVVAVALDDEDEDDDDGEDEVPAAPRSDDGDDEPEEDFSDWTVPSWNDLIAGLYRPDR